MSQVTWSGSGASGICLIGESPWIDEVRLGKPFVGAAGSLLDSQLRRASIDRDSCLVTNVLWTKPPYLEWVGKHPDSFVALATNRPNWENLLDRMKPKVIVTLGAIAMREVLGVGGLDDRQAYIHDSKYGCPVVPSYHPSHILRGNHKLTQCLFFALMRAKEVAMAGGSWQRKPVRYLIDPPLEEAERYLWKEDVYARGQTKSDPLAPTTGDYVDCLPDRMCNTLPCICGDNPELRTPDVGTQERQRGSIHKEAWSEGSQDTTQGDNRRKGSQEARAIRDTETTNMESDSSRLWSILQWTTRPTIEGFRPSIPLLAADIETPNSAKIDESERDDDPSYTIIRVSLSVESCTAITLPWCEPYITLIRQAVASAAVVTIWNENFDVPRLLANGCCINGEIQDAMWLWHWLQSDMLKGLGFVSPFYTDLPAWKHLAEADPTYYSCCDADALIRNYLGIRADIERQGRWQRFVRHCLRAGEVLRRPTVGRINIDTSKQVVLRQRLVEERDAALARLQLQVPEAVKPKKLRKIKPKGDDVNQWREIQTECLCRQQGDAALLGEGEEVAEHE